jgi:hypothetical protein
MSKFYARMKKKNYRTLFFSSFKIVFKSLFSFLDLLIKKQNQKAQQQKRMIGLIRKFINFIKWLYLQYKLNTALYMLEPSEVKLFNFMLVFLLVTSVYSTYVFLPAQVMRVLTWFSVDDVVSPGEKMADISL